MALYKFYSYLILFRRGAQHKMHQEHL